MSEFIYNSLTGKLRGKISDKANNSIHNTLYDSMSYNIRCMYYEFYPITLSIEYEIHDRLTEYKFN